eukprot:scaffold323_cov414-Prasinococcus_capsulatus_cf.AAC.27
MSGAQVAAWRLQQAQRPLARVAQGPTCTRLARPRRYCDRRAGHGPLPQPTLRRAVWRQKPQRGAEV